MDIFESTLKLKNFFHNGNQQLVQINDKIEISGFSPLPILTYYDKINKIEDYEKFTITKENTYLYDKGVSHHKRLLKNRIKKIVNCNDLTPVKVNTKEYWQFLHENFQFCDVASYYRVTDLQSYFSVKGPHYDSIIDSFDEDYFRDKKILEIGPGYGYLPKVLKERNIPCKYFCADIVRRFDHDNFIDVDGYTLSSITDKFDLIVIQDVIQHLGVDILKTYLKELKGMLNWDGTILIGTGFSEKQNFNWFFFGQVNTMMGSDVFLDYINEINLKIDWKPLNINGQRTGTILELKKY